MRKPKILSCILFAIQLSLSVILIYYIFKLNVIPDKYAFTCVFLIALFAIITAFLIFMKGKVKKIVSACISLVLSIIMLYPISIFRHTDNTLENIPGETNTYHSDYQILVRKDDSAKTLSDIADYKIGIETAYDSESVREVLSEIEGKLNKKLDTTDYGNHTELWGALIDTKNVGAILIDNSFYEMFEDSYLLMNDSIENYVKIIDKVTVSVEITTPPTQPPASDPAPEKSLSEKPFVLFVSGIDTAGKITTRSRSDANILAVINPNTKKMLLVTVPRDTYVPFPGITGGANDKLTHAGIYGDNCSVSIATLEQYIYTGVNIDRWIRVNFTSVEKIVDALGGITVQSNYNFKSGSYTYVKGANDLNGKQALSFARNRYSFAEGDMQRGRNQLEVVKGIFNKITSPAILTKYSQVLDEIKDCVQSNLSYDDMTNLVKMQLSDRASWQIESFSINVDYKYDYCYSMPGMKLCVGVMSEQSRQQAVNKINSVLNG